MYLEANPEAERASAFSKEAIGLIVSTIIAVISGYKDVRKGVTHLFKVGGFTLMLTFISAVALMNLELLLPHHARDSQCAHWARAMLILLSCAQLMVTNTIFVALMDKENTVVAILLFPGVLVLGMLASDEVPPPVDVGAEGEGSSALDQAYEAAMKSGAELASFGATVAFAMEGAIILGYLKNPKFGESGHPQVDLAVSFFATTVCTLARTITALPISSLFPSAKLRVVEAVKRLSRVMLAALISIAIILSVEFLEWLFMLSLVPELIACSLNVFITSWLYDDVPDAGVRVGGGGRRDLGELSALSKTVATMSFALMAATYTVYLGHDKYDVYVKASVLVMLAAIVSSMRQMARPFSLPRTGVWGLVVGTVTFAFPGLALVIAVPAFVRIVIHFYQG